MQDPSMRSQSKLLKKPQDPRREFPINWPKLLANAVPDLDHFTRNPPRVGINHELISKLLLFLIFYNKKVFEAKFTFNNDETSFPQQIS